MFFCRICGGHDRPRNENDFICTKKCGFFAHKECVNIHSKIIGTGDTSSTSERRGIRQCDFTCKYIVYHIQPSEIDKCKTNSALSCVSWRRYFRKGAKYTLVSMLKSVRDGLMMKCNVTDVNDGTELMRIIIWLYIAIVRMACQLMSWMTHILLPILKGSNTWLVWHLRTTGTLHGSGIDLWLFIRALSPTDYGICLTDSSYILRLWTTYVLRQSTLFL